MSRGHADSASRGSDLELRSATFALPPRSRGGACRRDSGLSRPRLGVVNRVTILRPNSSSWPEGHLAPEAVAVTPVTTLATERSARPTNRGRQFGRGGLWDSSRDNPCDHEPDGLGSTVAMRAFTLAPHTLSRLDGTSDGYDRGGRYRFPCRKWLVIQARLERGASRVTRIVIRAIGAHDRRAAGRPPSIQNWRCFVVSTTRMPLACLSHPSAEHEYRVAGGRLAAVGGAAVGQRASGDVPHLGVEGRAGASWLSRDVRHGRRRGARPAPPTPA